MTRFWKPIGSAPKDGSWLLLVINGYVTQGRWDADCNEWEAVFLPSHGCGCCSSRNPEPTRWAPLSNLED